MWSCEDKNLLKIVKSLLSVFELEPAKKTLEPKKKNCSPKKTLEPKKNSGAEKTLEPVKKHTIETRTLFSYLAKAPITYLKIKYRMLYLKY